jgi:ATP-dependent DNA helicase Q1
VLPVCVCAGILASGGVTKAAGHSVEIVSSDRDFAVSLLHLARGLGFSAGLEVDKQRRQRVQIHGAAVIDTESDQPASSAAARSRMSGARFAGFTVERIAHARYFGFQLSGNGRCLLSDFTVTHNSLLYQLPAVLSEGVTLVISPLLSLMEDQLIHLRAAGIESSMLCGTSTREEQNRIYAHMVDKHSKMRLLFATPEKISKSKQFMSKLEKTYEMGKLRRIVIDEAHCCSSQSHTSTRIRIEIRTWRQAFADSFASVLGLLCL